MAEVLVQFNPPLTDENGRSYIVRVCGRVDENDRWEGWIEFDPSDGGETLRTGRETEQPDRAQLEYWATGLTVSYLEGALDRARNPETPDLRPPTIAAQSDYARPAPSGVDRIDSADLEVRPRAVLDPFEVYTQGEHVLREELSALDEGHLRSIIQAHDLGRDEVADLGTADRIRLIETIVGAVRGRAG